MFQTRLLILLALSLPLENSLAFSTLRPFELDPIYKPNLLKILKLPTKRSLFKAFEKEDLDDSNLKDKIKQYFSKFDFDYQSNQVNQTLTTRNVGVHYALNSSVFTSVHVNTSHHMLNRKEMSITPGVGFGFYLNERKEKMAQIRGNPYFASK